MHLPPRWSLLLACVVQTAALLAWGSPELIHDEVDYISQGQLLGHWIAGESGVSFSEVLGRITLHNPGYATLAAVLEALTGHGANSLRLLQALAGLATGVVLFDALSPRIGARVALPITLVFWLHPSMVFFRLTLWPVAFVTLGTALIAHAALQLRDTPKSASSRRVFAWTLAILPFFAPSAWLLIPLAVFAWGTRRALPLCGPALALWVLWTLSLSLALGAFVPTDLSASRNVVLANHPAISEGRGSLWGDPEGKKVYLSELAAACSAPEPRARKRCQQRFHLHTARQTVSSAPSEAVTRALRRVVETWGPDRFLIRHLSAESAPGGQGTEGQLSALSLVLAILHSLLLGSALLGLRTPEGRAALWAAVVWSLPIVVAVGFTRMRQPALPFLLIAAGFGISSVWGTARTEN